MHSSADLINAASEISAVFRAAGLFLDQSGQQRSALFKRAVCFIEAAQHSLQSAQVVEIHSKRIAVIRFLGEFTYELLEVSACLVVGFFGVDLVHQSMVHIADVVVGQRFQVAGFGLNLIFLGKMFERLYQLLQQGLDLVLRSRV